MKKFLSILSIVFVFHFYSKAQSWATASLDINGVSAMVNSNGDLFWDHIGSGFEVPKGSGKHTIFAGSLWVGGLDATGQLHLGAGLYGQNGNDFFPGPVMNPSSYSSVNDAIWNQVWKINKTTIDSFRLGLFSAIPTVIANWPGNGDVSQGQAAQLADYVDMNGDGFYDPASGDYPCIKGDQAVFIIFNDDRNIHGESGGQKMKFEFHAMLYAFNAPGTWLDTTIFLNYKMFNRSAISLTNAYVATWMDLDIGYFNDDYAACDVQKNIFYTYNGDQNDGSTAQASAGTYGSNPPAQGVVFLRGPIADVGDGIDNNRNGLVDELGEVWLMSKVVYFNNDFTDIGNPVTAWDYYKYMSGRWKDSTLMEYGGNAHLTGGPYCDYMFPDQSDPSGWGTNFQVMPPWSEPTVGNPNGDRRGFASSGPFTISSGQQVCLDFAFVYARGSNGPASSVTAMQSCADSATTYYSTTSPCSCVINPLAVNDIPLDFKIDFYPNPTSGNITILWEPKTTNCKIEIIDVTGKIVSSELISKSSTIINIEKLSTGIYLIRISDGKYTGTSKMIKQ